MMFLLAKYWPFQHVFNVLIFKILNRQHFVVFIGSDNVMSSDAIVAPEGATFKAIETLGACFVAVSTLHSIDVAFLNSHDIQQTVHSKVGRQVFRIFTSRNLKLSASSGHEISPCLPLVRWSSFKQWRQNVWKQGNIFGSVNGLIHTEQDTSSCRLCNKVCKSLTEFAKLAKRINKVWMNAHRSVVYSQGLKSHFRRGYFMLIAPWPLRQHTTRTNHQALFDMFWLCLASEKGLPIFLGSGVEPK